MSKTADLHVRIDPETKTGAEELFSSFGITVSDAVIMFLRQSLMVGGLPFKVKQPRYNAETEAAMQEARNIMAGKIQTRSYSSFSEFLADIEDDEDAEV